MRLRALGALVILTTLATSVCDAEEQIHLYPGSTIELSGSSLTSAKITCEHEKDPPPPRCIVRLEREKWGTENDHVCRYSLCLTQGDRALGVFMDQNWEAAINLLTRLRQAGVCP